MKSQRVRGLNSLEDGVGLVGFLLVFLLVCDASIKQVVLCVIVAMGLTQLFSGFSLLVGFLAYLSIVPSILFLMIQWGRPFLIQGRWLFISLFLASFMFAVRARHSFLSVTRTKTPGFILALTSIGLLGMFRAARHWNSAGAFRVLVSTGEDNAAWLLGLASTYRDGDIVLGNASAVGGGVTTGFIAVLGRMISTVLNPNYFQNNADNGLVLLRLYVCVTVLIVGVWSLIISEVLEGRDRFTRLTTTLLSSAILVGFSLGLANSGHFSAVCAVLFVSIALLFAVCADRTTGPARYGFLILALTAIFSGSQAWFPLLSLFLVTSTCFFIFVAWDLSRRHFVHQIQRKWIVLPLLVSCALAGWLVLRSNYFSSYLNLEVLKRNLSLPGGYATISPWIVVTVVGTTILLLPLMWMRGMRAVSILLSAAVLNVFLFIGLSLIFPPHYPIYGPLKLLYVTSAILSPAVLVLVVVRFQHFEPVKLTLMVGALVLLWSTPEQPLRNLGWVPRMTAVVSGPQYPFVEIVVNELRESPNRPITCLNTHPGDTYWNYITYLCSRMSFGLGGFNEEKHLVWTALQICSAPLIQAEKVINEAFSSELTVIVNDSTRLTTRAGCQVPVEGAPHGWMSWIDWSQVRILDVKGNRLNLTWESSSHDKETNVESSPKQPGTWGG